MAIKKEAKTVNKNQKEKSAGLKTVTIPVYFLILLLLVISGTFYFFYEIMEKKKDREIAKAVNEIDNASVRLVVDDKYKLIRPLAFVEFTKEDTLLLSIKESILQYIEKKKEEGIIVSASAYIRNLNRHQEVRINPTEIYFPGSLMKIPILIAYLKEAEENPEILERQLFFANYYENLPFQNITIKNITPGNSYKISELLRYMIAYSDNNATALLNANIDFVKIQKVFADLQLPVPDITKTEFGISLKDYSRFFRVLFNASYLSWEMSEYGLELLTNCEFKDGLINGIDPAVTVAHKFGERNSDGVQQMHEIGIVYLKNKPYLIGVFTKGSSIEQLEKVIGDISKIAFDRMQ